MFRIEVLGYRIRSPTNVGIQGEKTDVGASLMGVQQLGRVVVCSYFGLTGC